MRISSLVGSALRSPHSTAGNERGRVSRMKRQISRDLLLADRAVIVGPAEVRAEHLDRPARPVDLGEHAQPFLAFVVDRAVRARARERAHLAARRSASGRAPRCPSGRRRVRGWPRTPARRSRARRRSPRPGCASSSSQTSCSARMSALIARRFSMITGRRASHGPYRPQRFHVAMRTRVVHERSVAGVVVESARDRGHRRDDGAGRRAACSTRSVRVVIRRLMKNLGVYKGDGARGQRAARARRLDRAAAACSPRPRSPSSGPRSTRCSTTVPPERVRDDKDEFRYEMLNRSAACQRAIGHPADPRGDRAAARRRLPRDRQHRVAQPARVPGRLLALRRRAAHPAARGRAVGRPHPVSRCSRSARTSSCRTARSPTVRPRSCPAAIARAGSRRSTGCTTRTSPTTAARPRSSKARPVTCRCSCPTRGTAGCRRKAGTVATSSRCTTPAATSRNASAPPTSRTSSAPKRSRGPTPTGRASLVGLHDPFFYDA